MKDKVMPNMISPQYNKLAAESTPTAAISAAVVAATLKAGAVPATPITIDSPSPRAPFSSCVAVVTALSVR
jgi:hypothetical protein